MAKFPLRHFTEQFCAAGFPSACLEGFSPSSSWKQGFVLESHAWEKAARPFPPFFFPLVLHPDAEWLSGSIDFSHSPSPLRKRGFPVPGKVCQAGLKQNR